MLDTVGISEQISVVPDTKYITVSYLQIDCLFGFCIDVAYEIHDTGHRI